MGPLSPDTILNPLWPAEEDACLTCDGEGGETACRCHGGGFIAEGCSRAVWTDCPDCKGDGVRHG